MHYRDVVIHPNTSIFGKDADLKANPPVEERIDCSEQVWIGRLDLATAKCVMDTCEAKTFGIEPPQRQFAQLYAFVRELPPNSEISGWDDDNNLAATVAISRLVHPTSTGFAYAARIGHESEALKQVRPAEISGISIDAFLSPNHTRDWLTRVEAEVLRELVPLYPLPLPPRIHNAFWHHEYAARTYYLDHRWTLICTGLEAMVHTDKYRSTAEFKTRLPQLAAEVGISLSAVDASEAYDLRSRLSHGVSILATWGQGPSPSQLRLYEQLEDTLRLAILKGMRDNAFGNIFRTEDQIRKRWPI